MAMTDYLELKLLDHVLDNVAYTSPVTIYVALFTSATADDGTGTEVSGNAYARVAVVGDFDTTGTTPTRSENGSLVTFPTASGGNWGTVTHMAIFDAASGVNMLLHGVLTTPRVVNDTDTIEFAIGALGVAFA